MTSPSRRMIVKTLGVHDYTVVGEVRKFRAAKR